MDPESNSDNRTVPESETRPRAPGINTNTSTGTIDASFTCIQESLMFVYAKLEKEGQVRSAACSYLLIIIATHIRQSDD